MTAVAAVDLLGPGADAAARQGAYPGIPLTTLGSVQLVPSETALYRRNGERINTVQGFHWQPWPHRER
jgi:hypothetical protein